jgi:ApbE superfamily uncharacterized protein (UPF0280 family)
MIVGAYSDTPIRKKIALTDMYEPRAYRNFVQAKNLKRFTVRIEETDLHVSVGADCNLPLSDEVRTAASQARQVIQAYILNHPEFQTSLEPLPLTPDAPALVRTMIEAGATAGVGPMAAVAGTIAEHVGRALLDRSPEVIVENGGDIFLRSLVERTVSIYAGDSPLSMKVGVRLQSTPEGLGVCTSSGTVGHSLSFGQADAVMVIASSTALADAAATALCNRVKTAADIEPTLAFAETIERIQGVVIILGDRLGVWGKVELVKPGAE